MACWEYSTLLLVNSSGSTNFIILNRSFFMEYFSYFNIGHSFSEFLFPNILPICPVIGACIFWVSALVLTWNGEARFVDRGYGSITFCFFGVELPLPGFLADGSKKFNRF
jgi:hypothetical protein